jgi:type II secretory pathway pseudopilin PulG
MSRRGRRASGFSMVEMLIASTLSLVLLSGGMAAGVHLQRVAMLQQQATELQSAGRAVKELLAAAAASAGSGLGTAPITAGTSGSGSVIHPASATHYALDVQTGAAFDDDAAYQGPAGQYAALGSDAFEVWTGNTDAMVAAGLCPASTSIRAGTALCTATSAAALDGLAVLIVNPALRTACAYTASDPRLAAGVFQMQIAAAPDRRAPPAGEPCDLASDADSFWKATGTYAVAAASAAYRVNWAGAEPALEVDPDGSAGPASWQVAATGVERLQVRQGVINLTAPGNAPVFFPSADGANPGIDQCTDERCAGLVPGGTDAADTAGIAAALERRVRVIEFDVTLRSRRPNPEAIQRRTDGAFSLDAEGHLTDGYLRRQFVFRVAPRNFRLAGLAQN